MDLKTAKKYLKVICYICIAVYVLFGAVGVAIVTGIIPIEAVSETLGVSSLMSGPDAALYATITGVVMAIAYFMQALFTVPVLRGIKNPSKMRLGIVLYGILTVAVGYNLIRTFMAGGELTMVTPQFIADICILIGAIEIYRDGKSK